MALNYSSANSTLAQAKIVFDAKGMSDDELSELAYLLAAVFPTKIPGREAVSKVLIQRAGARNWSVLKKIELLT